MLPESNSKYKDDAYELKMQLKYHINNPQPTYHPEPQYRDKYLSSQKSSGYHDVLKSSDMISSLGSCSKNGFQKNSSYFLRRMGMTQQQLNKPKKVDDQLYDSNKSGGHFKNANKKSFGKQTYSNCSKYLTRYQQFHKFVLRLMKYVQCNTSKMQKQFFYILSKNAHYNDSESNGNNFTQQNTRIDRLASCNIDIESVTDQQFYNDVNGTKQFDLSINSQTKSEDKFNPINKKKEVFRFDQNKQKSYFAKDDKISEYGFEGIVKNPDSDFNQAFKNFHKSKLHRNNNKKQYGSIISGKNPTNNKNIKKNSSVEHQIRKTNQIDSQGSLKNNSVLKNSLSNGSFMPKKQYVKQPQRDIQIKNQNSLSLLIRERSVDISKQILEAHKNAQQYHMPQWIKTKINDQPIHNSYQQIQIQHTNNCIYHLNPDTFKASTPDYYQSNSLQFNDSQQKHNTSLQIQLILRNNNFPSANQHSRNISRSNSNNDLSRRTQSQQIYQPNSINTNTDLIQNHQLQNTQITGHNAYNLSDQQQLTSRGISINATQQLYLNEKRKINRHQQASNYQRQANSNRIMRDYTKRPKSLSINATKSIIQAESPRNEIKQYNNNNQIDKTKTTFYFDQNNSILPIEPSLQPSTLINAYNNQNQYMRPNKGLIRFVHPQGTNILSIKPTRAVSSDGYSHFQTYRSPIKDNNWKPRNQYGHTGHQNYQLREQPSVLRGNLNSQFTNSPSHILSIQNQNNKEFNEKTQYSYTQNDKKLPVYYGVRSPRNNQAPSMLATNVSKIDKCQKNGYTRPKIMRNTQSQYFTQLNNNKQKQIKQTIEKSAVNKRQSTIKNNYKERERSPNQRILVFSSSKRKLK